MPDKFDKFTNVYLNMGFTYEFAGKGQKACEAYKASLETSRKFTKDNPGASLTIPKGFTGTYEDFILWLLQVTILTEEDIIIIRTYAFRL